MLKEIYKLLEELKKCHTRSERVLLVRQVKKEIRQLVRSMGK